MTINVGVIGYGYWGPNLVRNFAENPGGRVGVVNDKIPERLAKAQARYPGIRVTTNAQDVFNDSSLDAVALATPVSTHFDLAMGALRAGKHVFIEKPLTESCDQGKRLIEEAQKRKLVLLVDHTFIYTSAVNKIRDLITSGELGDIYYYDSVRINLGLFQHDVNVIWDLAVHDLSIMDYTLPAKPNAVSAIGISHVQGQPQNIAYLTLFFPGKEIGHIHVNWLAPVKVRRTLIGGSQKMVVYDDLEPSEKVKVYDKGITINPDAENIYKMLVDYRSGDMWAPRLDLTEALRVEITHFFRCIEKNESPISNGEAGLRIVRILEKATESMENQGRRTEL